MGNTMKKQTKKKQKNEMRAFKLPHLYTMLFCVIILVGILTYLVPAGSYARVEVNGRMVIDPSSFSYIPNTPVSPFGWVRAVPDGIIQSVSMIVFIMLAVGGLGVYMESGAFQKLISKAAGGGRAKNTYIIMVILMTLIALDSGYAGVLDGHIPYVPLAIGFAIAAGFDVMTGLAMIMLPTYVAFSVGPANPNPLAIAQGIAGLPTFSGIQIRSLLLVLFMAVVFTFVLRYASRVKKDPSKSISLGIDTTEFELKKQEPVGIRDIILLLMLAATIAMNVYGGLKLGWYVVEMSALFLLSGIIAGIVCGFNNHKIVTIFIDNAKNVFVGAMCIGIARGISIVLTDGHIIDTLIFQAVNLLQMIPSSLAAVGMFILQFIINFIVPSGSGQAAVTMPIMAPIGDVLGITRQTSVLAFQFGDGLANLIVPTLGTTFAFLGIARVEFGRYLKWVLPLTAILSGMAAVCIFAAAKLNFGPF